MPSSLGYAVTLCYPLEGLKLFVVKGFSSANALRVANMMRKKPGHPIKHYPRPRIDGRQDRGCDGNRYRTHA
jgi:hypothetical protein